MLSSQANTEDLDPVFLLGSARSVLSSHVLSEAFLSWEHRLPEPLSVTHGARAAEHPWRVTRNAQTVASPLGNRVMLSVLTKSLKV